MSRPSAGLPPRATLGGVALVLGMIVGCAPAGSTGATAAPTGSTTVAPTTAAPSIATSSSPVATALPSRVPRPSGTLAWPSTFQVELANGRYFTSPPFVIPFSLEIAEPGWYAGHLNPVFIDLQRYDGVALTAFPTRIFGFGWPSNVTGPDGKVPVANLTPEAAFDLLTDRRYLAMTNRAPVELLGRDGVRADFHATLNRIPIFGDEEGDFGLGPQLDLRLAAVPIRGGLLLILVQAAPDDLDAAWDQAVVMLETAEHLEGAAPAD